MKKLLKHFYFRRAHGPNINNSALEPDVGTTGGLHGTLINWADVSLARVADVPAGLTGRSLLCDRALSQYVDLAGSFAANPAAATIGGWYKRTTSNAVAIFGLAGGGTYYAPLFYPPDLNTYVGASTAIQQVSWAHNPDTSWHHVAVTVTGNTEVRIYFDGVIHADGPKSLANGLTQIDSISNCGPGYFWDGNLHDLRIYGSQLSGAEVLEWFNTNAVTGKSPIHRWTFN